MKVLITILIISLFVVKWHQEKEITDLKVQLKESKEEVKRAFTVGDKEGFQRCYNNRKDFP